MINEEYTTKADRYEELFNDMTLEEEEELFKRANPNIQNYDPDQHYRALRKIGTFIYNRIEAFDMTPIRFIPVMREPPVPTADVLGLDEDTPRPPMIPKFNNPEYNIIYYFKTVIVPKIRRRHSERDRESAITVQALFNRDIFNHVSSFL